MKHVILMWCGLLLLLGCEDPSSHQASTFDRQVRVATQSVDYYLRDLIIVTIYNPTPDRYTLQVCNSDVFYYRDKLTNKGWEEWTELSCGPYSELAPVELQSQSVFIDTINVSKPGTYRFRIPAWKNGDPNQAEIAYSNSFVLYPL